MNEVIGRLPRDYRVQNGKWLREGWLIEYSERGDYIMDGETGEIYVERVTLLGFDLLGSIRRVCKRAEAAA